METAIVIVILAAVLGLAGRYVYRAKKRGAKCIGCPDGVKCSGGCAGGSGNCCGSNERK